MLVDPYQDRYFKDGKVIGVNYSGPVGNQIRTETDLGLGLPVGGFTDRDKFGVLTPPGSTEQGKMEILTPPGSTEKGKFGVRIENLVFVKKNKNKIFFQNLTLAPIEKDLINYKLLNSKEKNYLFNYHLDVYSKISKFLNPNERKWLASFI